MDLSRRQRELDAGLAAFRPFWHPQPFREVRPAWCEAEPALAAELLALADDRVVQLADDGAAARRFLARHLPALAGIEALAEIPVCPSSPLSGLGPHWAWEIPGRKRAQIEAFAAAAGRSGEAVLDWCGGKGHLGRLLALHWQVGASSLDIDPVLCAEGEALARRAGVQQDFVVADALAADLAWARGRQAVALHACGELHRRLVRESAKHGLAALDVAPCCYYRGVEDFYQALSPGLETRLSRDDTRLAVTETVTAAPREALRRDRDMAWKLAFDSLRRARTGAAYRNFKSVPPAWLAGDFENFIARMAEREGLAPPSRRDAAEFERQGWRRQREVMRLSIVRHAFRRPLEIWLALDLAVHLEGQGYAVSLGSFCPRQLTPRNLLLSARR